MKYKHIENNRIIIAMSDMNNKNSLRNKIKLLENKIKDLESNKSDNFSNILDRTTCNLLEFILFIMLINYILPYINNYIIPKYLSDSYELELIFVENVIILILIINLLFK